MTPPRLPLRSTRSRFASLLGIFLMTCIFVGCAPATTDAPARSARPGEERESATAEQVYRSYIDASNAIDFADPATFTPAAEFTSEALYASLSQSWQARHDQEHVIDGDMVVQYFQVVAVHPDLNVEAIACLDLSDLTMVDRYGESEFPEDSPDFLVAYLGFISVHGEVLLDSQMLEPASRCRTSEPKHTLIAPSPGVPADPAADRAKREQAASCASCPDLTSCEC
ncbi:hypothetical protein [Microbacterium phyllosphaerae]|uniref:hypothetical protein n=1 Tax=Microbacterium phyllosphaerae TaxID=124798 RepID=UPI00216725C5|nr:hypothetical protein [Microbacterium phyllosphaerae]MCS3443650.1 biopolymer transport protein ExbD [Microbacterium phyllosphaerae]